jgi:hypothetical protein
MEGMRSKTEAFDIRKLDTLPPPQEGAAGRLPLATRREE